jgi:hypothetical protein
MPKAYKRITKGKYDRKKIYQYNQAGELVKEWDNATQINNELGFDKSAILRCCKGNQKKSYWYIWKFKEEETAPEPQAEKKVKKTKKNISEKVIN